jgi:hypothetical protein
MIESKTKFFMRHPMPIEIWLNLFGQNLTNLHDQHGRDTSQKLLTWNGLSRTLNGNLSTRAREKHLGENSRKDIKNGARTLSGLNTAEVLHRLTPVNSDLEGGDEMRRRYSYRRRRSFKRRGYPRRARRLRIGYRM